MGRKPLNYRKARASDWLMTVTTFLQPHSPIYIGLYGSRHRLLLLLLHRGGVQQRGNRRESEAPRRLHPRHPSGKATETYFDYLLNRITVVGAAYLVLICMIPEILARSAGLTKLRLGGTSLLIVVNVTMDTLSQIQSHLIAHQYGDLIKKAKLKTRRAAVIGPSAGETGPDEHHSLGPPGAGKGTQAARLRPSAG